MVMNWTLSLVFILCNFTLIRANVTATDEVLLKRYLLNSEWYDPTVRPVFNTSQWLYIYFSITNVHIVSLDEKTGSFTQACWMNISWKDEFLVWDPNQYGGIEEFVIPANKVWTPEVNIFGRLNEEDAYLKFNLVKVRSDGLVRTFKIGILTTFCEIDPLFFPFDYQRCEFKVAVWTYANLLTGIIGDVPTINVFQDENSQANPLWDIAYTEDNAPDIFTLDINFCLKRKPLYVSVLYIVPGTLHAILILVSFVLPSDGGEKISFGISLFLSFVVFLLQLNGALPEVSTNTPVLVKYFMLLIAGSVVSIINSSLESRIDRHWSNVTIDSNKVQPESESKDINGTLEGKDDKKITPSKWKDPMVWKKNISRVSFVVALVLIIAAHCILISAFTYSKNCQH